MYNTTSMYDVTLKISKFLDNEKYFVFTKEWFWFGWVSSLAYLISHRFTLTLSDYLSFSLCGFLFTLEMRRWLVCCYFGMAWLSFFRVGHVSFASLIFLPRSPQYTLCTHNSSVNEFVLGHISL